MMIENRHTLTDTTVKIGNSSDKEMKHALLKQEAEVFAVSREWRRIGHYSYQA